MKSKLILMLSISVMFFASCSLGEDSTGTNNEGSNNVIVPELEPEVTYRVSFDTDGGEVLSPVDINEGNKVLEPSNPSKNGYLFVNWYKDKSYTAIWDFDTDIVETDITLYAKFRDYVIGDIGPAGGLVFYDDEADGIDDIAGFRYMEAAPADLPELKAFGEAELISVADGLEIGTGKQNTIDIVNSDNQFNGAAQGCVNYSATVNNITYNDWHLPSQEELNAVYENLKVTGLATFCWFLLDIVRKGFK